VSAFHPKQTFKAGPLADDCNGSERSRPIYRRQVWDCLVSGGALR